ncbi:hypothetical protein AVEN_68538-1 [Araneus ventricosus]|uniref:Uncharacterized protein n=1 Tax=Araneus ventricosus TaxID=182803 RepID=A0A4Y2HCS4_ARAVE|nr:hypothetical protein AVEN_68538-1 [Araneus ventricosus]
MTKSHRRGPEFEPCAQPIVYLLVMLLSPYWSQIDLLPRKLTIRPKTFSGQSILFRLCSTRGHQTRLKALWTSRDIMTLCFPWSLAVEIQFLSWMMVSSALLPAVNPNWF